MKGGAGVSADPPFDWFLVVLPAWTPLGAGDLDQSRYVLQRQ